MPDGSWPDESWKPQQWNEQKLLENRRNDDETMQANQWNEDQAMQASQWKQNMVANIAERNKKALEYETKKQADSELALAANKKAAKATTATAQKEDAPIVAATHQYSFKGSEMSFDYYCHVPESVYGERVEGLLAVVYLHEHNCTTTHCSLLHREKLSSPGTQYLKEHVWLYTPILVKWAQNVEYMFDDPDLLNSLAEFICFVTQRHKAKPIVTGYSFGGHVLWQLLALTPDMCCCAIIVAGYTLDLVRKSASEALRNAIIEALRKHKRPIKIVHAKADGQSPMEQVFWERISGVLGSLCEVDLDEADNQKGAHRRSRQRAYVNNPDTWRWAHMIFIAAASHSGDDNEIDEC